MLCRHCENKLKHVFLDLGLAPPSNAYLVKQDLHKPESTYPLKLFVCENCWLVQTDDYAQAEELFTDDYAYFSSVSKVWLSHAKEYVKYIVEREKIDDSKLVIEVASNDGYLLKNFVQLGIPCIGIEPTESTASASEALKIPVIREFFGEKLAKILATKNKKADLIVGNNVYAHVPDINDFTKGLKALLKPEGIITLEFPHLLNLIKYSQFDTVYHEHFSYLSLHTVNKIFKTSGLKVFDVEILQTHGGSLRVFGCHDSSSREINISVNNILDMEEKHGLRMLKTYEKFQTIVDGIKSNLLEFLSNLKEKNKTVIGYGAAAKGNTLLNYARINNDLIQFVCDAAKSKQGKYLPGSHIPIIKPDEMRKIKPDVVLILPWNIADEIAEAHSYIKEWGGEMYRAIPRIEIIK